MDGSKKTEGFTDVGYDEAMRRARDLIPFLRSQSAEADRQRTMPRAVEAELHRTGLFRYIQPKSAGGMELDFVSYVDVPEMIARGDISTAWVVANLASHHRGLALYDKQAQDEIWNENPDALISSGIAFAQGRGERVPGGLKLTGHWNFSSGVDPSTWAMLACQVREDDKVVDYVMTVVPSREYEVIDDWQVLGMRGTGSKSVKCKDVFVPEHRALSMYIHKPGHRYPGLDVQKNPMFLVPTQSLGGHCIAACCVGNAQKGIDLMIEHVKSRSTSYQNAKMSDFQTVQLRIGAAAVRVDFARQMLRQDCIEAEAVYKAGRSLTIEEKLRYKRNSAYAAKLCTEAVDLLHEMAGANGIYDNAPLQQIFRDAHAAAGHFSFSTDAQFTPWALVALGGTVKTPTL